jgi:hypothetical protein
MGVKSFNTPYEIDLNTIDDEPVSVVINNEEHVIYDSCVRLAQIPDEFYRVTISGMTEINIKDDISAATEFKVDYKHGVVYFDQSLEGDPITIATYYGRGIKLVYAERIIARILVDGSYMSLQEMIDEDFVGVGLQFDWNGTELGIKREDEVSYEYVDLRGIVWKGTYSPSTTYQPLDAVFYNGSSYVCILESTGNAPTNITYWETLAQAGDMQASIYDPTSVSGDAFDADNHAYDNSTSGLIATDTQNAIDELQDIKADKTEILLLDNTTPFTPDADYEPATKKYVDDEVYKKDISQQYIGVEWNETSDTFTRIGLIADISTPTEALDYFPFNSIDRCNLADDGTVNAYYGEPLYVTDGSNGQCMTEFPLTYSSYDVRTEGSDKIHTWKFSQFQLEGFEVDKNFIRGGEVVQRMYFSTFEGSLYDVSASSYILDDAQVADFTSGTGDKLSSIANAKPISGLSQGLNIVNSRILANNRGERWGQQDDAIVAYLHKLMIMMYASMNSQSEIGRGVVDKASGTGNESELTGQCADIMYGAATGTDGLVSISFAGIENFWGNIWKWTDGVNIQADNKLWINISNDNYASDQFTTPYVYQGDLLAANVYPGSILDIKYGFYPDATGGSTSSGFTDYYYQTTGNRVALLGGNWTCGSYAGSLYWHLYYSSGNISRNVSARLLYR